MGNTCLLSTVLLLLLSALCLETSTAFTSAVVSSRRPTTTTTASSSSLTLLSAKKRRRRKDKDTSSSSTFADDADDLPDFDIAEDDEGEIPKTKKKEKTATPPAVIGTTPEGEIITAAMMASPGQQSSKSVRDLINDRSLEQKLSFDDDTAATGGEELPDLMQMARSSSSSSSEAAQPVSKKKARQAARQAAAVARQEEEESSLDALLKNVPFFLNEKGEVSGVKILEAGTWAGIGLLVAWEIYINSPLFERAAPITPVVFE